MVENGVLALLKADSGLNALVAGRIYPFTPPEAPTYPLMTYQVIVGASEYDLQGKQSGRKTVQFDAWSPSYETGRQVMNALRNALDAFSGTLSDGTRLMSATRGNQRDDFPSDSRVYRVMTEYELLFVEP